LIAETLKILFAVFNLSFMGILPVSTTGQDRTAGATRTFNLSGPTGYYSITEDVSSHCTTKGKKKKKFFLGDKNERFRRVRLFVIRC
jgi:hypothetical protein